MQELLPFGDREIKGNLTADATVQTKEGSLPETYYWEQQREHNRLKIERKSLYINVLVTEKCGVVESLH
jgi:hypothetical protein